MNEIKRIHLGRQPFVIAVDAYKALKEYLDAIKDAVGEASHKEVLEEVELRMAELLTEKGMKGEKAIVRSDIEYLQAQLGNPGDFAENGDEAVAALRNQASEPKGKRLFRDTEHGMIAGVSSGLAAYFGIDAVIIRLILVLTVLLGGWGIPLYLLLWIIVPEAKTSSEKLQMQGKPVTVDSLKQVVDEADVPGAARRASNTVAPFMEKLGLIVVMLIGIGFLITGLTVLLGGSVGGAYAFLYQDEAFRYGDFGVSPRDLVFGTSVVMAIVTVGIALMLVGVSLIKRKWSLPGWATAGLVAGFLVFSVVAAALAPGVINKLEKYSDDIHNNTSIYVSDYSKLEIIGDFNDGEPVHYEYVADKKDAQGYLIEMSYVGEPNTKAIKAVVADGTLRIDTTEYDNNPECSGFCVIGSHDMKLTIHGPALQSIVAEGESVILEIPEGLTQPTLAVRAAQGTSINVGNVTVDTATITSNQGTGVAAATFTGLEKQRVYSGALNISGSGAYIPRSNEVSVQTDRNCMDDMFDRTSAYATPVVVFDRMPVRGLTVNNQTVPTGGELRQLQENADNSSSLHCVELAE